MATPSIVSSGSFGWAGGYPLSASASFDATGATTLIVALTVPNGLSWTPAASYAGQAMTLLAQSSGTDNNAATIFLWKLDSPASGSNAISISKSDQYCAASTFAAVALSGTSASSIDAVVATYGSVSSTASVTTSNDSDLLLLIASQSNVTDGSSLSVSSGWTTVLSDTTSTSSDGLFVYKQTAGAAGAYSATATASYNAVSTGLIAVSSGGPIAQHITPAAIVGASAIGAPGAVYGQAAGMAGIAAAGGLGAPSIPFAQAVVAAGIPGASGVGSLGFAGALSLGGLAASTALGTPTMTLVGGFPITIAAGGTLSVNVIFKPTATGTRTGTLTATGGTLSAVSTLTGTATSAGLPVVSIGDATITTPAEGVASLSPTTKAFASVQVGSSSAASVFTLTNAGTAALSIGTISVTGPFTQTNTSTGTLAAGASLTVSVTFSPTAAGAATGTLTIQAGSGSVTAALTGTGTAATSTATLSRLSISGNQFVDATGAKVRLKSINFSGAEGENYAPHALWKRTWKGELDQIKAWGFNSIRLPFSGTFCGDPAIPSTAIDATINPDVAGKTALQFLDMIVVYCEQIGLYIVLDHHRTTAGAGQDGWPQSGGATGSYSESQWQADWLVLANRYKDSIAVVGADVHNEPYAISWSDWAPMVERCAEAIIAAAPGWLIFVEGNRAYTGAVTYPAATSVNNDNYWDGGQLMGAQARPISLSVANKVVYAPHEYGQSVASESWLANGSNVPSGWPTNLLTLWDAHWGWAYRLNVAPVWVGEFGGKFGYANADGSANSDAYAAQEIQWLQLLEKYLNGDFNGDGTSDIAAGTKGISFAYWNFQLSGDTGSLTIDNDLTTAQAGKIALLSPLLAA